MTVKISPNENDTIKLNAVKITMKYHSNDKRNIVTDQLISLLWEISFIAKPLRPYKI